MQLTAASDKIASEKEILLEEFYFRVREFLEDYSFANGAFDYSFRMIFDDKESLHLEHFITHFNHKLGRNDNLEADFITKYIKKLLLPYAEVCGDFINLYIYFEMRPVPAEKTLKKKIIKIINRIITFNFRREYSYIYNCMLSDEAQRVIYG